MYFFCQPFCVPRIVLLSASQQISFIIFFFLFASYICIYIYIYIYIQSQVESHQRLRKWDLIPPCLTQHFNVRDKVKRSNPGKGVAPFPIFWCSSYWKGSLRIVLDYVFSGKPFVFPVYFCSQYQNINIQNKTMNYLNSFTSFKIEAVSSWNGYNHHLTSSQVVMNICITLKRPSQQ